MYKWWGFLNDTSVYYIGSIMGLLILLWFMYLLIFLIILRQDEGKNSDNEMMPSKVVDQIID
jgi:preprotein translocase subunit YajC